jgi:DNA-binding response OmpR family regulator
MNSVNPASVLVVEDEPLMRMYLSDVLGQSGFDVIAATNGEDGLALARRKDVCAVVSDVAMPGRLNGF